MLLRVLCFLLVLVMPAFSIAQDAEPEAMQGENWEFIVNNAKRTADAYAAAKFPKAGFAGLKVDVAFLKQYGGDYKGRYLLKLVNEHGKNISFAMLLPLFDENVSSDDLDDDGVLWKVVVAKYNGVEF